MDENEIKRLMQAQIASLELKYGLRQQDLALYASTYTNPSNKQELLSNADDIMDWLHKDDITLRN